MKKIDRRKSYSITLDTETTNGFDDPLVYDLGFAVVDKNGKVYEHYSLVVYETFCKMKDLMKSAVNPEKMSVSAIFPYAAQISHFQKNNIALINEAKKLFKSFDIDTVDAFQGKECDVVLVNTVVTDATQRNFLNDFRRINVSMSRSRDKLIAFGNKITLSKINMKITGGLDRHYFKDIIEYISSQGKIIKYKEGEIDYGNQSKSGSKLA